MNEFSKEQITFLRDKLRGYGFKCFIEDDFMRLNILLSYNVLCGVIEGFDQVDIVEYAGLVILEIFAKNNEFLSNIVKTISNLPVLNGDLRLTQSYFKFKSNIDGLAF